MARVVIFSLFLLLIVVRVDSCSLPRERRVEVPHSFQTGFKITQVDLSKCDTKSIQLTSTDPSFTFKTTGEILARSSVTVSALGRTFSVRAQDSGGRTSEMKVRLACTTQPENQNTKKVLKRVKRRWGPPPFNVLENDKGPFPKEMETIVSDSSAKHKVYYTISGPGVDLPPSGVFSLNRDTGMLYMLQPIDREMYPQFIMVVEAFDRSSGQPTDDPLQITIVVDDVNDNAPTIEGSVEYTVAEKSSVGTIVGKIIATDRDQANTSHVKLRYTLLDGSGFFSINPETGVITTATNTLDREIKDTYLVPVEVRDMDGAAKGLHTTGTATITLSDINDNPPTFKETSYTANIQENENEKLILRIPVDDKDLENTPNWISKFIIKKGNEGGNFRIETDPKTNEGLLYVTNGLDYEKNSNVNLEIMARNEADLNGTTATWNVIPINVAVGDVDEGPQFIPPNVRINVKENTPNGTMIGKYTAEDPETKSSNGISYYKVTDPGQWITVDKNTGELRVANTIDRESKFVYDGLYNVTVKAVDTSSKTGTGTVILVIEDVNDNVPTFPPGEKVVCDKDGQHGSVVIVAEDKDQPPLSSPFSFSMPQDHDGKWSATRFNDTAVTLTHTKELPTGIYDVDIEVKDLQGHGKVQTVKVRICQCKNGVCMAKRTSVELGPLGILTLLLPLALLLLLCLLLIFFCVTKTEKREIDDSGDSGGILLKSNTEAPGEEVDSSLINVPITVVDPAVKGSVKGSMVNAGWQNTLGGQNTMDNGIYQSNIVTSDMQEFYSGRYDSQYGNQQGDYLVGSGVDSRYLTQNSGFLQNWQTNGRYLQQKLAFMGSDEDGRYADDIIHGYRFEGVGSAAGSVGCCSDYGDNNDLDFLNTLGPKFKTLADVCTKK